MNRLETFLSQHGYTITMFAAAPCIRPETLMNLRRHLSGLRGRDVEFIDARIRTLTGIGLTELMRVV